MANPAFFTAKARSRHPRLNIDYDPALHRYKSSYLKPNGYDIDLDAFPGIEEIKVTVIDHTGGNTTGKKTVKIRQRLKIPQNAISYDWKIERVSKFVSPLGIPNFTQEKSNPILPGRGLGNVSGTPFKHSFHVPSLGTYKITLNLRLKSGAPLEHSVTITLHDFLVVSVGESAASGEGNPDEICKQKECEFDFNLIEVFEDCFDVFKNFLKIKFTTFTEYKEFTLDLEKDPVWLEPKAHRSLRSGPARAARALESLGKGTMVTFLSFARSGSEIQGGLLGPRTSNGKPNDPWINNIGQIQEIKNTLGTRRIDALVIAIGGNDIGFADDLSDLVGEDLLINTGNDDAAREKVRLKIDQNLAKLDDNFKKLAQAVSGLNVSQVYLTEYPTGIFDVKKDANGQGVLGSACGIFESSFDADLDSKDIVLLRDSAVKLNDHLRKAAKDNKWFFIDGIAAGFAGHGYCADDPFFWSGEQSLVIQGDINGTAHPNLKGHAIYANQISAAVRTSTITPVLKAEEGVVAAALAP